MLAQLPALVTLLNVLLLSATAFAVGKARATYGIKAPATTGHEGFERAYRVQMNTLEQTVMFLPALWLAATHGFAGWAGVAGLVWIVGRVWYMAGYLRDPAKREGGFAVGMLAWLAVLVLAGIGVVRAMLAG
ncbi:MAPEG family protein [Dyella lutea]|uniref:MAPEG family protein n=1 Tax=Dyella lutea TaxID=2950441 RepID=A0ABT1FAT3_9GAMM|nr:MAPEG family protein [Dyella lutea]MCP1374490.1 MAPEG family protein [Dyella lutea]